MASIWMIRRAWCCCLLFMLLPGCSDEPAGGPGSACGPGVICDPGLTCVGGFCVYVDAAAGADAGVDAGKDDAAAPDLPGADKGTPDGALPDQAPPDAAPLDALPPDAWPPDAPLPDQLIPDQAVPDQLPPDLPAPDIWICGNGKLEGVEECESLVALTKTCKDLGYTSGTLKCDAKTCKYDKSGCQKNWPFGKDGPLRVGSKWSKSKVVLWPGDVWDFSEVTIESDGLVEVAPGELWVIVGVNGTVKIDGKLVGRTLKIGGTYTTNLPDAQGNKGKGPQISHTIPQRGGGNGGRATYHSGVGKTAYGNGGGGCGGKTAGGMAAALVGGKGGAGNIYSGGAGANVHGKQGGNGVKGGTHGTGGGGGFRGYHGSLIFFQVRGDVDGSGTIDLRGSPGGAGGNGGAAGIAGGGGGGGGAGGSGGRLVFKFTGFLNMLPSQFLLSPGTGGGKGSGAQWNGKSGILGQGGAAGSWAKVKWVE